MEKSPSAYKTIGEVARMLDLQPHVLRFWESKFSQIQPIKNPRGRRMYRPEDIQFIQSLHDLLKNEGMTIKGVQKLIADRGVDYIRQLKTSPAQNQDDRWRLTTLTKLRQIRESLVRARQEIDRLGIKNLQD